MSPESTAELERHLPPERFGAIREVVPISTGLSGAAVYFVSTTAGEYVLRVLPWHEHDTWNRQLAVLRLVSQHDVAPPLAYVDEEGHATVSQRIIGPPFGAVLSDPETRDRAIGSLVGQLSRLHTIPGDGIERLDPAASARELWRRESVRAGFPRWAAPLDEALDRCAEIVARDPRVALSHNDLNPGNVLWDGTRVWLVDWSASGLTHPYYDLATMSAFLQLPDDGALALLAAQEGARPSAEQAETFRALRRVSAILCGLLFARLTPAEALRAPDALEEAPTLSQCYASLRSGTLDLQSGPGRWMMALAMLRSALG